MHCGADKNLSPEKENLYLAFRRKRGEGYKELFLHFLLLKLPSAQLYQIGEGNGNPLQCSCLENLRDGGAWWATVYGVAESDTTEAA